MTPPPRAFVLVGPTAAGKTAVAHLLAARLNLPVLSADSMMVYRGLDIGTAKPTEGERGDFRYLGLDLADPGQTFTLADYLEAVGRQLRACAAREVILCGGTGLYVKALLRGLDPVPPADPALRAELEALHADQGVAGLAARLLAAGAWEALPAGDRLNPRRLMRAIERAASGAALPRTWSKDSLPVFAGLTLPRPALEARIRARTESMLVSGLPAEADGLRGRLGPTAAQAIGYAEALRLHDGHCTPAQAAAAISLRTRQYAKRQETWFRRQENAVWIDRSGLADGEAAERVQAVWAAHGPVPLAVGATV